MLHVAAWNGFSKLVELLLEDQRIDPKERNEDDVCFVAHVSFYANKNVGDSYLISGTKCTHR